MGGNHFFVAGNYIFAIQKRILNNVISIIRIIDQFNNNIHIGILNDLILVTGDKILTHCPGLFMLHADGQDIGVHGPAILQNVVKPLPYNA